MGLPPPRNGAVIHYGYLWKNEQQTGQIEATKDRPTAVVLAHKSSDAGRTAVYVLPITHSLPRDPAVAIEIPVKVKRQLGLDDDRSWILCDEVNHFIWPGYDLRPVPGRNPTEWEYGLLGRELYEKARDLFLKVRKAKRLKFSDRK
ncbi:MAG: growth inhibitor PemK [Alphaproteobacteria bacterium]|nr:growth inhibitor PemK [Alphaproteobacteria bacterium]